MTRLQDVTPFGARFTLKRPTEIGRLLHLTMPMPRALRVFDHVEDQYRVWSIVRNLKLLHPAKEGGALIEVGVAFIGKRAPRTFESDPSQRYEVTAVNNELTATALVDRPQTDKERETRHTIPVSVLIEVFDEKGALSQSEPTVTENISLHGASVFTSLLLAPGRFVKVTSEQYRVTRLAAVRDSHTGADGISRLHLEFIGKEWPLDV